MDDSSIAKHPANRKMARHIPTKVKKKLRSFLNKKKSVDLLYAGDIEQFDFSKGSYIVEQGLGLDGWELGANILRFMQAVGGEKAKGITKLQASDEIWKWFAVYSMVHEIMGYDLGKWMGFGNNSVIDWVKSKITIRGKSAPYVKRRKEISRAKRRRNKSVDWARLLINKVNNQAIRSIDTYVVKHDESR